MAQRQMMPAGGAPFKITFHYTLAPQTRFGRERPVAPGKQAGSTPTIHSAENCVAEEKSAHFDAVLNGYRRRILSHVFIVHLHGLRPVRHATIDFPAAHLPGRKRIHARV
jgi:hypothetical protein